jgi:uncharacterized membrane protein
MGVAAYQHPATRPGQSPGKAPGSQQTSGQGAPGTAAGEGETLMTSRTVKKRHVVEHTTEYDRWELIRRPIIGGVVGFVAVLIHAAGGNTIGLLVICAGLAIGAMYAGRD